MYQSKVEKITFYSDVLGKEMAMQVYVPESSVPLPVLYFFSTDEAAMRRSCLMPG